MYAIINTGGKQYRVEEGQIVKVERVEGEKGSTYKFDKVLMVGGEGTPKVGRPYLDSASVEAEITDQGKAPKVLVFKKKRRKGYKKMQGHRQQYTEVKVSKILS